MAELARKGWNQSDLAQAVGITRQAINMMLNRGTCKPLTAIKISDALGIDITKKEPPAAATADDSSKWLGEAENIVTQSGHPFNMARHNAEALNRISGVLSAIEQLHEDDVCCFLDVLKEYTMEKRA